LEPSTVCTICTHKSNTVFPHIIDKDIFKQCEWPKFPSLQYDGLNDPFWVHRLEYNRICYQFHFMFYWELALQLLISEDRRLYTGFHHWLQKGHEEFPSTHETISILCLYSHIQVKLYGLQKRLQFACDHQVKQSFTNKLLTGRTLLASGIWHHVV
jgi:hypothetical protein